MLPGDKRNREGLKDLVVDAARAMVSCPVALTEDCVREYNRRLGELHRTTKQLEEHIKEHGY